MEIRVLGDFDFTREVISGVARLFSYDNGFGYASGVLLVLYLMWNMLQHGLNPEKSTPPVKEFIFGIVLWLMLGGGGSSAKFDVMLTSMTDPSRFEYIEDVPALAVIPGWLASNLFGEAREMLEDEFTPAAYSLARGQDPLGALTRMWDTSPPVSLYANNKDEDIAKTFQNYMVDCWEADQALNKAPATVTIAQLMETDMAISASMIEAIKVDYNGIFTRVYLGDSASLRMPGEEHGIRMTCPEAWTKLNERFGNGATYKIVDWVDGRIADPDSMRQGLAMIRGTYTQGEDAYGIAVNLFVARMVADGVNTAFAADTTRMVFEAYRKHVFEQAGQAEVFKSFMIPVITAMEAFSFFIAPVMIILTVLGGFGLSYMGKYISLVLYMNLWGFTKVFVDLFTAIAVERAYSHGSNTAFTFGDYPTTIQEIEGFLSVASTLTASIPALAMFILYGGAKTLSPFVNSATKGSVDGSAGAPSISSSMHAGVRTMANSSSHYDANSGAMVTGFSSQNDNALGSYNFSKMVGEAAQATVASSESGVRSDAESFNNAFSEMLGKGRSHSMGGDASSGGSASNMSAKQLAQGYIESIANGLSISNAEASKLFFAASIGADADEKVKDSGKGYNPKDELGTSRVPKSLSGLVLEVAKTALGTFGISGDVKASLGGEAVDQKSISKAKAVMDNYTAQLSNTHQAGDLKSYASKWSIGDSDEEKKQHAITQQKANSFTDSATALKQVSDTASNGINVNDSRTIDMNATSRALDISGNLGESLSSITGQLNKLLQSGQPEIKDSLAKLGLDTSRGSISESDLATVMKGNLPGGAGFMDSLREMTGTLAGVDANGKQSSADMKVASALWGGVFDTLSAGNIGATITEPLRDLRDTFSTMAGKDSATNRAYNYEDAYANVSAGRVDVNEQQFSDNVGYGAVKGQVEKNLPQVKGDVKAEQEGLSAPTNDKTAQAAAEVNAAAMNIRHGGKIQNAATTAMDVVSNPAKAAEMVVGAFGGDTGTDINVPKVSANQNLVNLDRAGTTNVNPAAPGMNKSDSLVNNDSVNFTPINIGQNNSNSVVGSTGLTFNGVAIGSDGQGLEDVRNGESVQYRGQEFTRDGNSTHLDDEGNRHPIFNDSFDGQYYYDNGRMNYIRKDE